MLLHSSNSFPPDLCSFKWWLYSKVFVKRKERISFCWCTLSGQGMAAVTRQTEAQWAGSVRKNLLEKVLNVMETWKRPAMFPTWSVAQHFAEVTFSWFLGKQLLLLRDEDESRQWGNGWASRTGVNTAGDTVTYEFVNRGWFMFGNASPQKSFCVRSLLLMVSWSAAVKHHSTLDLCLKYAYEAHIKHTHRCSDANSWVHELLNKRHLFSSHGKNESSCCRTSAFQNLIVSVLQSSISVNIPGVVILRESGLKMEDWTLAHHQDTN